MMRRTEPHEVLRVVAVCRGVTARLRPLVLVQVRELIREHEVLRRAGIQMLDRRLAIAFGPERHKAPVRMPERVGIAGLICRESRS